MSGEEGEVTFQKSSTLASQMIDLLLCIFFVVFLISAIFLLSAVVKIGMSGADNSGK